VHKRAAKCRTVVHSHIEWACSELGQWTRTRSEALRVRLLVIRLMFQMGTVNEIEVPDCLKLQYSIETAYRGPSLPRSPETP
jgi:hypothetical protein